MTVDHYAGAQRRWAEGATLVYGPIARQLLDLDERPWAGRLVLDAGAGTGAVSGELVARGARPVAADLSPDMLAWQASVRPAAVVADVCALPLATASLDASVASFVLNHLAEPERGFVELIRVTRPGGTILATVFSNASKSAARDRIDEIAIGEGWQVPTWYLDMKANATPVLGTAPSMAAGASAAGLVDVVSDERPVDVGVTSPEELVRYRFGQAHFTGWLEQMSEERAGEVMRKAADAARPLMVPYQPVVVFLAARAR